MSKFAKDIKVNDILWTISEGIKPQLLPLIVTDINIKKQMWTGYYDLTVKVPDGSDKYISLFDTGERRDYDIPWLTDLSNTLVYTSYEDLKNSETTIMACFDEDALWCHYVKGLEQNIKFVEEVIEKGKKNLIELNEKLNYIKKQHDSIQNG